MAEVFAEFGPLATDEGRVFIPRVCGGPFEHRWEGWLEFTATDDGEVVRTPRETTQPNRVDLAYWASGLTAIYVTGALSRALTPPRSSRRRAAPPTAFEEPAPAASPRAPIAGPQAESVFDPFSSMHRSGEQVLRQQLEALAARHLVNIVRSYSLSEATAAELDATPQAVLVDLIVSAARARLGEAR